MKMRDKWKKTKITLKKAKKSTKIEQALSLQKNIYYNIITITLQNTFKILNLTHLLPTEKLEMH